MRRYISRICGIAIALCGVAAMRTPAQDLRIVHFSGVFNDYTPSTVSGGPYEMHGEWSLDVQKGGTASFSADMTMETSDYGITGATQVGGSDIASSLGRTAGVAESNAAEAGQSSAASGSSSTGEPPAWAARMKRSRTVSHGVSAATHAVRSADHGGSGATVDLSEGEH